MRPPVVLCEQEALDRAVADLVDQRWNLRRGFEVPDEPWDLSDGRWVCAGAVLDDVQAQAATLALARGCAVVVAIGGDAPATFIEDLERAGDVRRHRVADDRPGPLSADEDELLSLLAQGLSVQQAAGRLFLSTRTAQRRLATARAALDAKTTRQAVLAWTALTDRTR